MNSHAENALRIAGYLEDKMTLSEEETFMHDLGTDEALRKQYEDELMISGLLNNQNSEQSTVDGILFQPADEHIKMIEAALEKKDDRKKDLPVIKKFNYYKLIAAASVVVILISLVFIFVKKNNDHELVKNNIRTPSADTGNNPVSAPIISSAKTDSSQIAANAFKNAYISYVKTENDPIEISEYYRSYQKGNYTKVLSATKSDYETMGSSNRDKVVDQYMQLYKGLASLAENKTGAAIKYFDSVLQSSRKTDAQFYDAQWYMAMAYLKSSNIVETVLIAKKISASSSSYKVQAAKLLEYLGTE